jgi:hypothetical protein
MAKKDKFQSGLDAILNGRSQVEELQEAAGGNVTVCFRCSPDRIAKIRTIARVKGVSLKDVMEAAMDLAIGRYESNNGTIEIQPLKGNVEDIFN